MKYLIVNKKRSKLLSLNRHLPSFGLTDEPMNGGISQIN
jgi:hypothetical protein